MRDLESFIAEIESLAASEQNFAAQFGEAYQLVRPHEAGFFFDVMPQKKTVPIYARNRAGEDEWEAAAIQYHQNLPAILGVHPESGELVLGDPKPIKTETDNAPEPTKPTGRVRVIRLKR